MDVECGPENVDHLVAALSGDRDRRLALEDWWAADLKQIEQGKNPLRPPLLGLREAFARVQRSLADFIPAANTAAAQQARQPGTGRHDRPDVSGQY